MLTGSSKTGDENEMKTGAKLSSPSASTTLDANVALCCVAFNKLQLLQQQQQSQHQRIFIH